MSNKNSLLCSCIDHIAVDVELLLETMNMVIIAGATLYSAAGKTRL